MFGNTVEQETARASTRGQVTFIIRWTATPDMSVARAAISRRDRTVASQAAFHALKREVLDQLRLTAHVSVKDLPGTATAIVTATPGAWRRVEAVLRRRKDLTITPNAVAAFAD